MASAVRSKATALASAATKAASPAIESASKHFNKLIADNAQYVVKDKDAADKLAKQLVFTKLASLPDTAAACSSEWKIVKQTWARRQDLPLSEAGLYAAFVAVAPLLAAVSGQPLDQTPLSRVALGRWRDGGEELLACRLSETELEIHCHGGAAAAERVLESLRDASVVVVDEADWTPAPGASFAVAEAARQLPRATTPRTAGVLLDQLRGAWDREADEIQQLLNDDPAAAVARIEQLEMHRSLGRHLTQPFKVALCGAPNAGKSTLLNCMAGFSRSIVWDQPGTTRDAVAADIAIDGWPVRLIDTAGIRETGDALERQGAERARQAAGEADLIVEVFDATAPAAPMFPPPALQVHNKVDLLGEPGSPVGNGEPVFVSALTGDGIDVLLDAIRQRLVSYSPPAGAAVPFHLQLLDELAAWRRRAEQP